MALILVPEGGTLRNDRVIAYSAKEPKRTHHAGRTWDSVPVAIFRARYLNMEVIAHFDSTRGRYWYFEFEGNWYKASFMRADWHPVRAHRFGYDILDNAWMPSLRLVREDY